MKLPEWNRNDAWFDDYNRFYIASNKFVRFESGEMIVTSTFDGRPNNRRTYKDFNVQIVSTTDDDCPRFTMPGGEGVVPKAWLNDNGGQMLLVDFDHECAVGLRGKGRPWQEVVPESLRSRAYAYWHGPGSPPVGSPVAVTSPRKLTPAERAHVEGLRAECNAWVTLTEQHLPKRRDPRKFPIKVDDLMKCQNYMAMTVVDRMNLSLYGWYTSPIRKEVPYLMLAGGQVLR